MKLNKKGITIVELIVSVALISVIMLFMYKLLAEITFERENDYMANLNQEQRIEIVDNIESYLDEISLQINNYSVADKLFGINNMSIIQLTDIEITLKKLNGTTRNKWTIEGGTIGNLSCESKSYEEVRLVHCHIPIYTKNVNNKEDNNNTLDDIFFSVMY